MSVSRTRRSRLWITAPRSLSPTGVQGQTEFYIEVQAELNLMMKMMIGGKVREGLDKIVDSLVDISNGVMPEGFDPSNFRGSPFNF